jgi:hypothetical protein
MTDSSNESFVILRKIHDPGRWKVVAVATSRLLAQKVVRRVCQEAVEEYDRVRWKNFGNGEPPGRPLKSTDGLIRGLFRIVQVGEIIP